MTGTIGRSLREPLTQPNIPGRNDYIIKQLIIIRSQDLGQVKL